MINLKKSLRKSRKNFKKSKRRMSKVGGSTIEFNVYVLGISNASNPDFFFNWQMCKYQLVDKIEERYKKYNKNVHFSIHHYDPFFNLDNTIHFDNTKILHLFTQQKEKALQLNEFCDNLKYKNLITQTLKSYKLQKPPSNQLYKNFISTNLSQNVTEKMNFEYFPNNLSDINQLIGNSRHHLIIDSVGAFDDKYEVQERFNTIRTHLGTSGDTMMKNPVIFLRGFDCLNIQIKSKDIIVKTIPFICDEDDIGHNDETWTDKSTKPAQLITDEIFRNYYDNAKLYISLAENKSPLVDYFFDNYNYYEEMKNNNKKFEYIKVKHNVVEYMLYLSKNKLYISENIPEFIEEFFNYLKRFKKKNIDYL